MKNLGWINLKNFHEEDIQERDRAIIDLWDALQRYVALIDATRHPHDRGGSHPLLEKYRQFVNENRSHYGL